MRTTEPAHTIRVGNELSSAAMHGMEDDVLELLREPCFEGPLAPLLKDAITRGVWNATVGGHAGILSALVDICKERGLNWHYSDETKYNLLSAIEHLQPHAVDILLAKGANPNYHGVNYYRGTDPKISSPFERLYGVHIAASAYDGRNVYPHELIAESLIAAGADLRRKFGGKSPLDLARRNPGHPVTAVILDHLNREFRRGFMGRRVLKPAREMTLVIKPKPALLPKL